MSANLVLTHLSKRVHRLDPQSGSLNVDLPDARVLSKGGPVFVLLNVSGTNSLTIRDDGGATLLTLATNTGATVLLVTNVTANGKWRFKTDAINTSKTASIPSGVRTDQIQNLESSTSSVVDPECFLPPWPLIVTGTDLIDATNFNFWYVDQSAILRRRKNLGWRIPPANGAPARIIQSNGYVYITGNSLQTPNFYRQKVNMATGAIVWQTVGGQIEAANGVALSEVSGLLYESRGNHGSAKVLQAYSLETGELVWDNGIANAAGNQWVVADALGRVLHRDSTNGQTYLRLYATDGTPGQVLQQSTLPSLTNPRVIGYVVKPNSDIIVLLTSNGNPVGSNVEYWMATVNSELDTLVKGPSSLGTINGLWPHKIKLAPNGKIWLMAGGGNFGDLIVRNDDATYTLDKVTNFTTDISPTTVSMAITSEKIIIIDDQFMIMVNGTNFLWWHDRYAGTDGKTRSFASLGIAGNILGFYMTKVPNN